MKILAVDDEQISLDELVQSIKDAKPDAQLEAFNNPKEALEYINNNICDVAFLDIEMGQISGIEVAKQIKLVNPKVNIIFVTGYNEYMSNAFKLRVSGYCLKPITTEMIVEELQALRTPVISEKKDILVAHCFGNFDVFVNGKSVVFERNKTKELLAYLIDRNGSAVTSAELRAVLWEESENEKSNSAYLQLLKKDLMTTLKKAGVENSVIIKWNKYAIDKQNISCDYYDYLDNKPDGIRAYNGQYMTQYSWSEYNKILSVNVW